MIECNGKKAIILGGYGDSTNVLYHFLVERINIEKVILEQPVTRGLFLKRRIKKFGISKVIGQIFFTLFVVKYLKLISKKRISQILAESQLNASPIPTQEVIEVNSANADDTIAIIQSVNPDIVFVNGTRILSQKLLSSVDALFINIHAGITPLYRGVHGAYWALVSRDYANIGVTVHLVDKGVDTGPILARASIQTTSQDNFVTYPYLQLAKGLCILNDLLPMFYSGKLVTLEAPEGKSALWTHPTLIEYFVNRVTAKVK